MIELMSLSMLPNGKPNGVEIQVIEVNAQNPDETNENDVFGVKSKTIQSLPDEILDMIFGCLTHTEKLISRLVCTDWNIAISTYFSKNGYFVLSSDNGHQVLLDTTIPWTGIQISGYGFKMSMQARNCITNLNLTLPKIEFDLVVCLEFLLGFPNTKSLTLGMHDSTKPKITNVNVSKLEKRFKNFVQNLEVLEISFQYKEYSSLIQLLSRIAQQQNLNLIRFKISEKTNLLSEPIPVAEPEIPLNHLPISLLLRIITSSSKSLKHLVLEFYSGQMRLKLHEELLAKLPKISQLETAAIRCTPTRREFMTRDFEFHQKLIQAQKNLKHVILPYCGDESICQNLLLSLTSSVKIVQEIQKKHVSVDFPRNHQSFEGLFIDVDAHTMDSPMFSKPCPSVRVLGISQKSSSILETNLSHRPFFENLAACFSNVVQLNMVFTKSAISPLFDKDLQLIIENFEGLRILQICRCKNITDFGVTGINLKHCQKILRNGSVYIGPPEFKICSKEKVGLGYPLGSLKKLEELILGPGSTITDVGLYYGFAFGSTLKSLKINLCTNPKVSNWGVNWIGKHNLGLEEFKGIFIKRKISSNVQEFFVNHPLLLKSTGKCSFKYVKSQSPNANPPS